MNTKWRVLISLAGIIALLVPLTVFASEQTQPPVSAPSMADQPVLVAVQRVAVNGVVDRRADIWLNGAGNYAVGMVTEKVDQNTLPRGYDATKAVCNISMNGTGTMNISSNLSIEGSLTILRGTCQVTADRVTAGNIFLGLANDGTPIVASLGSSTINVDVFAVRGNAVTLDAGTSTINTHLLFDNAAKQGHTYYNVNITEKTTVTDRITYVTRTETRKDMAGKDVSVNVTDKVVTQVTSKVNGFVEGKSKFEKLTFVGDGYITDDIEVKNLVFPPGKLKGSDTAIKKSNKPVIKDRSGKPLTETLADSTLARM